MNKTWRIWYFSRKLVFRGSALSKNAQNDRFWAAFSTFAFVNRSANQQKIQLDVLHHDLKLTTGFEIFLAVRGVILAQNWSKIAYLMEYCVNVAHRKMLVLWIKELPRVLAKKKIRLLPRGLILKGYLCCKTTTFQNVLSEAQVKNFFIS